MALENLAPDWIFSQKNTAENLDKSNINSKELERIASMPSSLNEDAMVAEKSEIEKCASSKKPYHFNDKWSNEAKTELKEYASICGTKLQAVNPEAVAKDIKAISSNVSNSVNIRTASSTTLTLDPFKIDQKLEASERTASKWEDITKQSKLADKPVMDNGIVPVRGGENYYTNSDSKVARGQNSITSPDAIGVLAANNEEDTGARLKRKNLEKEVAKKARHQDWQKEKADAMADNKLLNRSVFASESMNAQPGIRGEVFDFTSIPEQTAGEKLKVANEERKNQIQGTKKEKHQFNVEKNPTPHITDTFAEELKKLMK